MEGLLFSSKLKSNRRDNIRKYVPSMDKRRELEMAFRKGSFRRKMIKDETGKWTIIHEYEPSLVYRLHVLSIVRSEEKIKQRQAKTQENEQHNDVECDNDSSISLDSIRSERDQEVNENGDC